MADLRASLDEETEVKPAIRRLVQQEFDQGNKIRKVYFPEDSNAVGEDPRMTLVVMGPDAEWRESNHIADRIGQWTRERGDLPGSIRQPWSGAYGSRAGTCGTR